MTYRPNILFIMTDQQRYDSLGCYGCSFVNTPNLDRLAEEGVLFENCYVNCPICTPSRASIFTGKEVMGHSVYKLHDNLPDDQILFPKLLQQIGYKTALFGKLHVCGRITEAEKRHINDGFDIYEWCLDPGLHLDSEYNAYAKWLNQKNSQFFKRLQKEGRKLRHFPAEYSYTHWAAERTIDFIENQDNETPFFCYMSLFDPHDPYYDYPLESEKLIDAEAIPEPSDINEKKGSLPRGLIRELEKSDFEKTDKEEVYKNKVGYYASIAFLDREIGRVLDKIEEKGLNNNTLIIFLSDHGDMMGDKKLFTKGAYFYDACTKVPFIMRYPGTIAKGIKVKSLVQPHDVASTILSCAGYDKKEIARIMPNSIDLINRIKKKDENGHIGTRDHAVCVYRNTGYGTGGRYFDPPLHATMFRDERYKLNLYHYASCDKNSPEGELYDMKNDPEERRNLWNDTGTAEIKMFLMNRLINWIVEIDVLYNGTRGGESLTEMSDYRK